MSARYAERVDYALSQGKKAVCPALVYQTRDRGVQLELLIGHT
jgi:hypothetical protein